MKSILGSFLGMAVTVILIVEITAYHAYPKTEKIALGKPLSTMPTQLGGWRMVQETTVEDEVQAVLQADETLSRSYLSQADNGMAHLFVAFFKSQRTGVAPHSPKVCLPGSGWVPSKSEIISVPVGGQQEISVNSYLVQRGDSKSVVLYWYQSPGRAIASEYEAKIITVLDSLRYQRSDTALVRVIQTVDEKGEEVALQRATSFVKETYPLMREHLPHL